MKDRLTVGKQSDQIKQQQAQRRAYKMENNIDQVYYGLRADVQKKNPALAELITIAGGSYEVLCNMCEAALTGEVTVDNFKEKFGHRLPASHELSTFHVQESDPMGLTNIEEAKKDPSVAMLFGNAPGVSASTTTNRPLTEAEKTKRTIRKHNGAADNGNDPFTETTTRTNIFAKGDKIINESLGLTAEQQRVLNGKQPAAYDNFTAKQKNNFDFARLIGLSEANAFKVAKL
jgi:hypothetical protein